jgi:hypothetical protein
MVRPAISGKIATLPLTIKDKNKERIVEITKASTASIKSEYQDKIKNKIKGPNSISKAKKGYSLDDLIFLIRISGFNTLGCFIL